MNFSTRRLRARWLLPVGAVVAAFGLLFAVAPAHADITYTKEISTWASSNDSGGRDASARLRASNGDVHYKALFRAYDEVIHVYDYYDEGSRDYQAFVEINVYDKSNQIVSSGHHLYTTPPGGSYARFEIHLDGYGYNVPEGWKIQMRLCRDSYYSGPCTGWVYGIA
ncbi:MAG: hypothetical protein ACRDT6_18400 [Micromonosporaceae bacterium]